MCLQSYDQVETFQQDEDLDIEINGLKQNIANHKWYAAYESLSK